MKVGIYKDTLSNRRGADIAVLALAEGLRERLGTTKNTKHTVVVFDKKDFEKRITEPWDVVISTGTNELLDLYDHFSLRPLRSLRLKEQSLQFPFCVIQQFHTNPKSQFKRKHFLRNWKIRRALRHVDAIQVLSERFVPQVERYGAPVSVIGNWSEHHLTTQPPNHLTIIYPAAFAKGKNQKLLIEAFAQVAAEFPDWRLRLLGRADGAYADECRRLAARTGIADKVYFAGFCDDLAQEYACCAFVAFPSASEGFGLVIADAAAFAKPCVMVEDWIGTAASDGGIVAEPTPRAYAQGLRRLMEDPGLRRRMGEAARKFASERYSRERILDKWEALLKRNKTAPSFASRR